jgi:hypothetical protein
MKMHENQKGLKWNWIHQLLVYANDVNQLGDNIDTIRKNRNFDTSKEVSLEVNAKKTKYMLQSHNQNVGQNQDIKITDPLKRWHCLNIWEQQWQIKIWFRRKLRRLRTSGRPRQRWVDNIKMYLREIWWGGMDFIDLAEDRDQWRALVNTVMNLWVP